MNIKEKKLMILGGNPETAALVEKASAMGVFTIVVDPKPDSPAKKKASKSYNVDGMDILGLLRVAQHEKVDGILVGVADILVGSYQKVCEKLQLPCYASENVIKVLTRKDKFNEVCSQYGISVIPSYNINQNMDYDNHKSVKYPIMVKPVDNGGGVGMSICYNEDELRKGIKTALDNSIQKAFVVERYMICDDMFAYYTFKEGEVYLSAVADRFTTKKQGKNSPVCIAAVYPSKNAKEYYEKVHPKMSRMFKGLGIKNGVLMIQFFVEHGNYYAYDPGFRLQGEAPHLILNAINGFDHREMLINFALTGSMGIKDLAIRNDYMLKGKYAGSLWILLKKGKIAKISGLDGLNDDPDVLFVQRLYEGDFITEEMVGTERQVMARIYIICDSKEQYRNRIRKIEKNLDVLDEYNGNMILTLFDPNIAWA